jgi:hypothetical protein
MKNIHVAIMASILTLLVAGCDNKSNSSTDNSTGADTNLSTANAAAAATNAWLKTKEATTNAWDATAWDATKNATANAWTDIKESMDSATDYTYDKKDQFVSNAQSDLDSLDQKIQSMSSKADDSLRQKRADLDQKLTDVKNATQDNWNSVRDSFVSGYDDVKNYVKQAWSGSSTNSQ